MSLINIKELSQRESERVEWKENVADIEDIIKASVAFANDYSNLGGGYIVCGAKETKDNYGFQQLVEIGLTSKRIKEIEGKVIADLREKVSPSIVPLTEHIPVSEGKRILIFIIPASRTAHSYRMNSKDASTYYIRDGSNTIEAKNSILQNLLIQKNQLEPFDIRMNSKSSIEDIDIIVLREYLQEMNLFDSKKSIDDYLSENYRISAIATPLFIKESLTNILKPRNFAILLFGRDVLKYFEGAYTLFTIYNGNDRSETISHRYEITGNIVQQAKRCVDLLNSEAYIIFNKTNQTPNQNKYPQRALLEAVINCIVHRDYEMREPARITIFNNRIEIQSPGSLPKQVNKERFLRGEARPYWRNQSLAYFFNKLQLAQGEGQGIPTIFRTMQEEGCPVPEFEIEDYSLTCILRANPNYVYIDK